MDCNACVSVCHYFLPSLTARNDHYKMFKYESVWFIISSAGGREIIEDGPDVREVADLVWGVDEPVPLYFLTDSAYLQGSPTVFVVEVSASVGGGGGLGRPF